MCCCQVNASTFARRSLGSEGGDGLGESNVVLAFLQRAPQVLDRNRDGAPDDGFARHIANGLSVMPLAVR
jgi:hypothetical protein